MKKNKKLLVTSISLILLSGITLTTSFNNHNKQSEEIINKDNIKEKLDTVAIYIKDKDSTDYTLTENIPSKSPNYTFNSAKSICTNDVIPLWNNNTWSITLKKISKKGTSCYLYFDEVIGITTDAVIAEGTDSDDSMFSGIEGNGVYTWTKGDYSGGTQPIKYFRGNVDNNWVVFGKNGDNFIWWRIIRNNSNGSLRMIYAGLSADKTTAPATTGDGTQIGKKAYNSNSNNGIYVGFKYTSGEMHGTGTNSTILGEEDSIDNETLYGWYNQTIGKTGTNYSNYLDLEAGFCNDRKPTEGNNSETAYSGYYGAETRINDSYIPTLLCANSTDVFKTPMGLITADEVNIAGMVGNTSKANIKSYLYTNNGYWTMSPFGAYVGGTTVGAGVFRVDSSGYLHVDGVSNANLGVRPVINLKSSTQFEEGGNGTISSPYVVSGT